MLLINEQSTIIYDTNLLVTEAENQPPIANNDNVSIFEDEISYGNVLSNDSDPDGDLITVTAVNGFTDAVGKPLLLASGAVVIIEADGSYSYDPNGQYEALNEGESAIDNLNYTVSDPGGASSNGGNLYSINGKNQLPTSTKPPIAVDDAGTIRKDGLLDINILANDSNPEGGNLAVIEINGQAKLASIGFFTKYGVAVDVTPSGNFTYIPRNRLNYLLEGQSVIETFDYTVVNNGKLTATAKVTVTVQGFNDLPPGFDPAQYGASNPDLIPIYRGDLTGLTNHYLLHGRSENRPLDNFDEFRYTASSYTVGGDLIKAYGLNGAAATLHYLTDGFFNGRSKIAFDPARYLDSYPDLITAPAIGTNTLAATQHFITSGFLTEGRNPNLFPSDRYLASHIDLINAYKSITDYAAKVEEASKHYLISGRNEPGRQIITFDPLAYMAKHPDVAAFANNDPNLATFHYITVGFSDGHTP